MLDLNLIKKVGEPCPEDKKVIVDGMLAYHAQNGHPRKTETFSILLKDQTNKLFGCVMVSFLWNGMSIESLWVEESVRHQGWGRKLMAAAEEEGKIRNCTFAYTNTYTWQAPDFYTKLGYSIYGQLADFPPGSTLFYFRKNLI